MNGELREKSACITFSVLQRLIIYFVILRCTHDEIENVLLILKASRRVLLCLWSFRSGIFIALNFIYTDVCVDSFPTSAYAGTCNLGMLFELPLYSGYCIM